MSKKENCKCHFFPVILTLIALIIAIGIWYFDDSRYSFSFLTRKKEIFNFIGTVLFVAILPIGLYYLATEKEKYKNKAKQYSFLGFIPALLILLFILL